MLSRDEERRRLERDLHDGAQQSLLALRVKVELAERLAGGGSDELRALLGEIHVGLVEALAEIRGLLRGLSPHGLEVLGLRSALLAHVRSAPIPVDVRCAALRYPAAVERSVFFCCAEAIQNVIKHAGASRCAVRVWQAGGRLELEVHDDGRGFDPALPHPGTGLRNLRDRITALGGELALRSAPGRGTTVRGSVPLTAPGGCGEPRAPAPASETRDCADVARTRGP